MINYATTRARNKMDQPPAANCPQAARLMIYMTGFRVGASGGWQENMTADFKAGHDAGRAARQAAYVEACKTYGTELSPLRRDG